MQGLIIKIISGDYFVKINNEIIKCKPLGVFRHKKITPKVGDNVIVENNVIIENVIRMKSERCLIKEKKLFNEKIVRICLLIMGFIFS